MAWVMPVLSGVAMVMEAVTFIQFIEEEAIQACGLGIFLAIRSRNYNAAWPGIALMEQELVPHLELVNEELGWLAIYSQGAFHDFAKASRANIDIYKELCTTPKEGTE